MSFCRSWIPHSIKLSFLSGLFWAVTIPQSFSCRIYGTYLLSPLQLTPTMAIMPDCLPVVLFVGFSMVKLPAPISTLWKEVTIHNPHLGSGELGSISLRLSVYIHYLKFFWKEMYLFSKYFFLIQPLMCISMDSWICSLYFRLEHTPSLFIVLLKLFHFYQLGVPSAASYVSLICSHHCGLFQRPLSFLAS